MDPVAFQIGAWPIHWYGVLVMLGFLAGIWVAAWRAPLVGLTRDQVYDLEPWLIVGALVGSRLWYVASYWEEEFAGRAWWTIFMTRQGGLVFHGGLVGATLGAFLFIWRRKLRWLRVADLLAPSIALGYFFGRLGCFMTGCCFGTVSHLPWAVCFPNQSLAWNHQYQDGLIGPLDATLPVHPTQLYESASGLLLFALLVWWLPRRRFDGQVFGWYLVGNSAVRFGIEFLRGDYHVRHLGGWATSAQLFCLGLLAAGAGLLWYLGTRQRPTAAPTSSASDPQTGRRRATKDRRA